MPGKSIIQPTRRRGGGCVQRLRCTGVGQGCKLIEVVKGQGWLTGTPLEDRITSEGDDNWS
jgi:hypothetical protein